MRTRTAALALAPTALAALVLTLLPASTPAQAGAAPGAPRSVDVDLRSGGAPAFTITWAEPVDDAAVTGYEVVLDGEVAKTTLADDRGTYLPDLQLGRTYRVAVRAVAGDARSEAVGEERVLTYGAATPRHAANPTNPLARQEWGVYLGLAEHSYEPWLDATGTTKAAIGEITLQPKAKWFGRWIKDADIGRKVDEYIVASTLGDPDVMSQMTIFRSDPWEGDACKRLPTKAQIASYKRYLRSTAEAIGNAKMAVVLQPDGPFARCAPGGSKVPSRLIGWAGKLLSDLPRTSVYIEMGSADWFRGDIRDAVRLLVDAGVKNTRGFALDVTHYDKTSLQISFGARIVEALNKRGITDKHFVIDTSDNGRGFSGKQFHAVYPDDLPVPHAKMCRTPTQKLCVALGIPPTTDVANPRWGLPVKLARLAAKHVDAYLWVNRPWLYHQTSPFVVADAVALADQNPYR